MAKTTGKQNVKMFKDQDDIGVQEILIDMDDVCEPWILINHDGDRISLSLNNWNKLVELVDKCKKLHDLRF